MKLGQKISLLLVTLLLGLSEITLAQTTWSEYQKDYLVTKAHNRKRGMSFLLSGLVVSGASLAAYNSSADPLARTFYALSQTLGLAAAGEGASLYFGGSENQSFYEALNQSRSLTETQKNELVRIYLSEEADRIDTENRIRAWTYAAIATLNFYNAAGEKDNNLRTGLYVLGAANLSLSLSFVF